MSDIQAGESFAAHRYLDEYQLLSTVHQFFSSLTDLIGPLDDLDFDVAILENDIRTAIEQNYSRERIAEMVARLLLWRQVLEKFDGQSTVANLRHHFEEVGLPDPAALELILGFYLTKTDHTEEDRDKIDLIVTRWGRLAFQTRENETLLLPAPALREHIEELCHRFDLKLTPAVEFADAVATLERERKQLLTVRSLRELVEKQVLLRLRRIKGELGELFYQPAILSEVVALNISLHNVFQDLFLAEQARLTTFLQQQSGEQTVTAPDQVLVGMIERPHTGKTGNLPPIPAALANDDATENTQNDNVTINRAEILDLIQNMRSMLSLLDQQLHSIVEKLDS